MAGVQRGDRRRRVAGRNRVRSDVLATTTANTSSEGQSLDGRKSAAVGAQFVDVTVSEETGEYEINKMVFAADCGVAINPRARRRADRGRRAHESRVRHQRRTGVRRRGNPEVLGFRQYGMPRTTDHPPMETIIVETHEPTGPFGAKSIAELPTNGVPPALSNAIRDAVGVRVDSLPITADDIKRALDERDGWSPSSTEAVFRNTVSRP